MTGNDLANWRRVMKMNISQASEALEVSRTTLYKWENNKRNDIPYHIGLACAAIYHRFPAWPEIIGKIDNNYLEYLEYKKTSKN